MVSAGFEVSATVGKETKNIKGDSNNHPHGSPSSYILQDSLERRSVKDGENRTSDSNSIHRRSIAKNSSGHLIDSMVDWLENVPENELYVILFN